MVLRILEVTVARAGEMRQSRQVFEVEDFILNEAAIRAWLVIRKETEQEYLQHYYNKKYQWGGADQPPGAWRVA